MNKYIYIYIHGCLRDSSHQTSEADFISEETSRPFRYLANHRSDCFQMSLFLSIPILLKTPCMSSPCRNGGTCQPIYDKEDYQCICPFGNLIGKNCENCE